MITKENFEKYKMVSRPSVERSSKGDLALKEVGRRLGLRPVDLQQLVTQPRVVSALSGIVVDDATLLTRPAGSTAGCCRSLRGGLVLRRGGGGGGAGALARQLAAGGHGAPPARL